MRKCFCVFIVLVILLICALITCFYGNPFKKWGFTKKVNDYLISTYSRNMDLERIDYSFKENKYIARVHDTYFNIEYDIVENAKGFLQDDYFISVWKNEITVDIKEYIANTFEYTFELKPLFLKFNTQYTYNDYKNNNNQLPNYRDLDDKNDYNVTLTIVFDNIYTNVDETKLLKMVEFIYNNYSVSSITIQFNDKKCIIRNIDYESGLNNSLDSYLET